MCGRAVRALAKPGGGERDRERESGPVSPCSGDEQGPQLWELRLGRGLQDGASVPGLYRCCLSQPAASQAAGSGRCFSWRRRRFGGVRVTHVKEGEAFLDLPAEGWRGVRLAPPAPALQGPLQPWEPPSVASAEASAFPNSVAVSPRGGLVLGRRTPAIC